MNVISYILYSLFVYMVVTFTTKTLKKKQSLQHHKLQQGIIHPNFCGVNIKISFSHDLFKVPSSCFISGFETTQSL